MVSYHHVKEWLTLLFVQISRDLVNIFWSSVRYTITWLWLGNILRVPLISSNDASRSTGKYPQHTACDKLSGFAHRLSPVLYSRQDNGRPWGSLLRFSKPRTVSICPASGPSLPFSFHQEASRQVFLSFVSQEIYSLTDDELTHLIFLAPSLWSPTPEWGLTRLGSWL